MKESAKNTSRYIDLTKKKNLDRSHSLAHTFRRKRIFTILMLR